MIDNWNKIISTLNSFNQLKIKEKPVEKQLKKSEDRVAGPNLIVSNLISNYLKDLSNKSNAGYSIRYNSEKNCYTINGNKMIEINDNKLTIKDKIYNATNGLLELLIKKTPNFTLVSNEDKQFCKQWLDNFSAKVWFKSKKIKFRFKW